MKQIYLLLLLSNIAILYAQIDPYENLSLNDNNCWLYGDELGLYDHFADHISENVMKIIVEIEDRKIFLGNHSRLSEGQNPYKFSSIIELDKIASDKELLSLLNYHKGIVRIFSTLILIKRDVLGIEWYQIALKSLKDNEQLFNYYDCADYPFYTGSKIIELIWDKLSIEEQRLIKILYEDSEISNFKEEKRLSIFFLDITKLWN